MDTLVGLLALAGLIFVGWGWYRLKAATRKKLNQSIFARKDHEQGQRMTSEQLSFSSTRDPQEVLAIVRERLDLAETPGPLPRLYLAGADDEALVFAQGSKLGENFRAALMLEPSNSGSSGHFVVLSWTEVDGIVGHLDDLEYLRRAVENAVREADPDTRFDAASL